MYSLPSQTFAEPRKLIFCHDRFKKNQEFCCCFEQQLAAISALLLYLMINKRESSSKLRSKPKRLCKTTKNRFEFNKKFPVTYQKTQFTKKVIKTRNRPGKIDGELRTSQIKFFPLEEKSNFTERILKKYLKSLTFTWEIHSS